MKFSYNNGELIRDNFSIREAAGQFGAPVYLYSRNIIREVFQKLKDSLVGF